LVQESSEPQTKPEQCEFASFFLALSNMGVTQNFLIQIITLDYILSRHDLFTYLSLITACNVNHWTLNFTYYMCKDY